MALAGLPAVGTRAGVPPQQRATGCLPACALQLFKNSGLSMEGMLQDIHAQKGPPGEAAPAGAGNSFTAGSPSQRTKDGEYVVDAGRGQSIILRQRVQSSGGEWCVCWGGAGGAPAGCWPGSVLAGLGWGRLRLLLLRVMPHLVTGVACLACCHSRRGCRGAPEPDQGHQPPGQRADTKGRGPR